MINAPRAVSSTRYLARRRTRNDAFTSQTLGQHDRPTEAWLPQLPSGDPAPDDRTARCRGGSSRLQAVRASVTIRPSFSRGAAFRCYSASTPEALSPISCWLDGATLRLHKVLSTPEDPAAAIIQGIAELGLIDDVARGAVTIVHGSTVATNAALEGNGARTAYVTNRGFTDVLRIARQARSRTLPAHARSTPRPCRARIVHRHRRAYRAHRRGHRDADSGGPRDAATPDHRAEARSGRNQPAVQLCRRHQRARDRGGDRGSCVRLSLLRSTARVQGVRTWHRDLAERVARPGR